MAQVLLPTHTSISQLAQAKGQANAEKIKACFAQTLALGRLARAWDLAAALKHRDTFHALGKAAMRMLDVPMAIRAHRAMGDAGMVMALQKLEGVEDIHLLSGHLALIFDDHSSAQVTLPSHFLATS